MAYGPTLQPEPTGLFCTHLPLCDTDSLLRGYNYITQCRVGLSATAGLSCFYITCSQNKIKQSLPTKKLSIINKDINKAPKISKMQFC